MKNKMLKITLSLTDKGLEWQQTEWDYKETKSLYKLSQTNEYNEIRNRHVKRVDYGKVINNVILNSLNLISYSIWIKPDSLDEVDAAKKSVLARVKSHAKLHKDTADKLYSFVEK